ncbi:hypothetical protein [Pontibacter vulgaris]|uniref:hypothetical protein n=1 Tax=Pontibacter vulgaris TaxID=2905679 RepID=UPI001FA79DE2|nr:hypothetical protein [Pontibacter vulgaris]
MKTTTSLLLSLSVFCLIGCSEKKPAATTTPGTAAPATTIQQPANGAVALNPAHGQPGHRCDIEVGAPLNLPPQPRLNTAPPALSTPPVSTPVPVQSNVAAGTNPPHGQPGHDCGIPVGAPLNK